MVTAERLEDDQVNGQVRNLSYAHTATLLFHSRHQSFKPVIAAQTTAHESRSLKGDDFIDLYVLLR